MPDQYLLIRNGYYFRPNAKGYTASRAEAGRFDHEYAVDYCGTTDGVSMIRADLADETAPVTVQGQVPDNNIERDALRYRYLRNRDLDAIEHGGVFAGMTPENFVLNGEDLDREIDAALASN